MAYWKTEADMRQKIPIIGQHFVKEVPPSDNVRTSFCSIRSLFSHGGVRWNRGCVGSRVGLQGVLVAKKPQLRILDDSTTQIYKCSDILLGFHSSGERIWPPMIVQTSLGHSEEALFNVPVFGHFGINFPPNLPDYWNRQSNTPDAKFSLYPVQS
jgi:hypothetical protein